VSDAPWRPEFDIFERREDDARVMILVDLAAHPLESHPLRMEVFVDLQRPRPDGLRDESELDEFSAAEDLIIGSVQEKLDGLYLGRYTVGGQVTFLFHLPEEQAEAARLLGDLVPDTGAYELEWGLETDPEWLRWQEAFLPDPYELQGILNRRLLRQFEEGGDDLAAKRRVDHFALFETEEAAKKAAAALEAKGFRIDGLGLAEDEDEDLDASGVDDEPSDEDVIEDEEEEGAPEWHLAFSREDALADGRPDEFVGEVLDVVHEHGGAYDGWGAPHVDKPS
jgi:hypothetical protein